MRTKLCAVLLASLAGGVSANTLPSRQLALDYVAVSGIQDTFEKAGTALGQELVARGIPGGEEGAGQLLASTIGWTAVKEDFIALIQRTYTAQELEAMNAFARSPVGRGMVDKNRSFALAVNDVMVRQARLFESMVPAEARPATVTMDRQADASGHVGVAYAVPPNPVYPVESRAKGEEGVVTLFVLVGPQGDAEAVGVRKSSGFPRLDESALAALAQAKFRPYTINGTPVRIYAPATLTFQLSDDDKLRIPFRQDSPWAPGWLGPDWPRSSGQQTGAPAPGPSPSGPG